ncbi:CBS domain-containing protein [Neptuniibacter sp. 1_MG-2023]|uniref:CBS domain-containing protein n=1 Tax=Neptuniibacter sp. 1_MG-2023 TaxID=3062662 RepID=UPI0026E38453|nr:CBS domain-containing protein [Neptuniibacter sp. 1_MG-2023]MDO6593537.1 CBS domain-containing protein [Neptuniibacter sp. 1_MG-2023]
MKNYNELNTVFLEASDLVMRPEELTEYTLETPAITILTDFSHVQPLSMELDVSIDDARHMMRKVHVRSVLVIDSDENFKGFLTLADLESRSALSVATTAGIKRQDISIRDVMTPRAQLKAIPLSEIQSAKIGNLLQTLKHEGTPHILVVDTSNHSIRGVISSSDIARRLNISVDISKRVSSFQEVVGLLASGQEY